MNDLERGIRSVLPADVVAVASPVGTECRLYADELLEVVNAVPSRRTEFAVGRDTARKAMARLGLKGKPLLRKPSGEPAWPPGVVGSISHDGGVCVAAVTKAERMVGLGIDLLDLRRWRKHDMSRVPEIAKACGEQTVGSGASAAAVAFSLKEAAFKSLSSILPSGFGFLDILLDLDGARRVTRAWSPLVPEIGRDGSVIEGEFRVVEPFLFSAVWRVATEEVS